MNILLATDFSSVNKTLVSYALDLLRDTGGCIILFHAYLPSGNNTAVEHAMQENVNTLQSMIREQRLDNIVLDKQLLTGKPEETLLASAQVKNADLILMGTRGRGNKRFLEGSLSKSLMDKSPIPLLSIHEDYHYRESKEVLYVTNFNHSDVKNISRVTEILRPFHPHLHIVHFLMDGDPVKASRSMNELEASLKYLDTGATLTYKMVYATNAHDAMKVYCDDNDISLAAFVPRRRRFFDLFFKDTVSKNDFYDLHIPLLTFI